MPASDSLGVAGRVAAEHEAELERVGQPELVEVMGRGERNVRAAGVWGPPESGEALP